MVFPALRLAVLVDGCFWHSCPLHATTPRANADYWIPKLKDNVVRDRRNDERGCGLGQREAAGFAIERCDRFTFRIPPLDPPKTHVLGVARRLQAPGSCRLA
jgi:hypothetical protein